MKKLQPKYIYFAVSFVIFSNEIKHLLIYKRVVTNQIICRTGEAYGLSEV